MKNEVSVLNMHDAQVKNSTDAILANVSSDNMPKSLDSIPAPSPNETMCYSVSEPYYTLQRNVHVNS